MSARGLNTGFANRFWVLFLAVFVCSSCWSCAPVKRTRLRLKEQELRQLRAELDNVTELNAFLDQNPAADTSVPVVAFLNSRVVNEALSKADRTRTPLKQMPSVV